MIDNNTKEQIAIHLIKYCDNEASDNQASKILGISNAYISNIRNKKWDMISDDMWRKISKVIGIKLDDVIKHADTTQFKNLTGIYNRSKSNSNCYAVTCHPGSGKTYSLDTFRQRNANVYYSKCKGHTSESEMYQEILRTMGKNENNRSINALLHTITQTVERREAPTIIIDELEKVKTTVILSIIDLYNTLEYKCGIVLIGTPNLRNRIEAGLEKGKLGFNEWYSRIGGAFIEIPPPSASDAASVIRANDIVDQTEINSILNDSLTYDKTGYDLRRVDRLIQKIKREREKV